jgi:hypothetical protein
MRKYYILVLVAATFSLQGCATITRGSSQSFEIKSTPPGANARLSTGQTCVTPCSLNLKRKTGFDVVIDKDGFQQVVIKVTPTQAGKGTAGLVGNALVGGVIGAGVDVASGAMKDLTPNPVTAILKPLETAALSP